MKRLVAYLLPALGAMVMMLPSCTPPEKPEPPRPPKPVNKERTIAGRALDDYRIALDAAQDSVDLTYYLKLENHWQIDSTQLHQLQSMALEDIGQSNLTVQNPNGYGIYAPDDKTQYVYDVWKTPGWGIVKNPTNDATPIASLVDYRLFAERGQKNIREKPSDTRVIEITKHMAGRFSAVIDSVLIAIPDDIKIEWRQNSRSVTMDDRTLGLINRPDSRIQTDEPLRIKELFITTAQYAIGDTLLRTDMHVRNSTALGVKPKISLHHEPTVDFYVDIVVAHNGKNVVSQDVSYWVSSTDWRFETFDFVVLWPDALPFDYPIKYTTEDGRQVNGYYGLDAKKYAIMLDDKTSKGISETENIDVSCAKVAQNFVEKQVAVTNTISGSRWFIFWTPKQHLEYPHLADVQPIGPYVPIRVR